MPTLRYRAPDTDKVTEREKRHQQVAYEAASESIVLLENDGTLPLAPCNVALFGGAAAMTQKGGTGSGEVNARYSVGIREGLENAGFTVKTDRWIADWHEAFKTGKEEYKKANPSKLPIGQSSEDMINVMSNPYRMPAGRLITEQDVKESEAKVCIYAIARQAGECSDRSLEQFDFTLMPDEINNLRFATEHFDKTILVINCGGSMDISSVADLKLNAIIYFCQQGMEGGNALGDIICGKVNPSGGLTDTWVNSYEDVPFGDGFGDRDGNPKETDYNEGIFVGYKYYDSFKVPVKYAFGHGLSYTTFKACHVDTKVSGNRISTSVEVENTGNVPGKRFVQIYVSCPAVSQEKEDKKLVGFAKSKLLNPGEKEVLTVEYDLHILTSYVESESAYVLDEGNYVISIGFKADEVTPSAVLFLDRKIVLEKCTSICKPDKNIKLLERNGVKTAEEAGSLPVINIDSTAVSTTVYDYTTINERKNARAENWLSKLGVEQKLSLLAGVGIMAIAGRGGAYFHVPGAAAYTTCFEELGITSVALCDGPAGIRLQRVSAVTKKGTIKPMEMMMDYMNDWPEIIKRLTTGNPKKDKLIYQNATAFPVGTALAMTWNQELVEKVGDAAGAEMEEFGCTFWLAPGMNIHRNPLCGRNFEYYSEDSVVSGKMAAAISRGVQSHEGCYVTIKHFAANNQERNRAGMSSNMTERTAREIYLEGFRIAVKEGGARALMTSYNKLNHVFAPNSHDLCTKALRNEWGFDGVVMTDWMSTDTGLAGRSLAYKAGNDLIMPGGPAVVKECLKDYKEGRLTIEEIDACCIRVLKAVAESAVQKEYFE